VAVRHVHRQINAPHAKGIYLAVQFIVEMDGFLDITVGANALDGHLLA
jgi:hypothetical protein